MNKTRAWPVSDPEEGVNGQQENKGQAKQNTQTHAATKNRLNGSTGKLYMKNMPLKDTFCRGMQSTFLGLAFIIGFIIRG